MRAGIIIADSNHIKDFVENKAFLLSVSMPSCLLCINVSTSPKIAATPSMLTGLCLHELKELLRDEDSLPGWCESL